MLRGALLRMSRSEAVQRLATSLPVSSGIVARYVPGETAGSAVAATEALAAAGLSASLDYLGEDTTDLGQAEVTTTAYLDLLRRLSAAGLAGRAEVSIKLSALGRALPTDGRQVALDNARRVCAAAAEVGTTATLDMEDHTTTDATLEILTELRRDFPATGAVLQAYLRRTEADCKDLAYAGSRVRLCKGAYREPESVAFQSRREVDVSYVRCLKVLMAGQGYPMVATHDPRLVEIAGSLARRQQRPLGDYEYQMLYGIRPDEQRRLAGTGATVRVYVPYGDQWYGYLMRRLAERPANLAFFVRSLLTKG